MGRHTVSQETTIWDTLTRLVNQQVEAHPRRYRGLMPGQNIKLHDEFGGEHVGIINSCDPLHITWRY